MADCAAGWKERAGEGEGGEGEKGGAAGGGGGGKKTRQNPELRDRGMTVMSFEKLGVIPSAP